MKSTFVLTAKCLVLAAVIVGGCAISEIIDFNLDFSGSKSISFQYREADEKSSESGEVTFESAASIIPLAHIDSAFQWVDHVSNLKIDTSDFEVAVVSYDFEAPGPKIKNEVEYNKFVNQMPEGFRWYFKHRPNTFRKLSDNKIMWKRLDKDLSIISDNEKEALLEELDDVECETTLRFGKAIQLINDSTIVIGADKKTIQSSIDLGDVVKLKRKNDIILSFE